MSLFNEMQVGRFNRYVQKLLSMKGPPSMPTVASDLQFVYPINSGAEDWYLQSWDYYSFFNSPTAGAATLTQMELRNPQGSNAVAVLKRVFVSEAATDSYNLFIAHNNTNVSTNDQPTIDTTHILLIDTRSRPNSTLIASNNNGAVTAPNPAGTPNRTIWQGFVLANTTIDLLAGQEVPLLPGDAIVIQNGTNATRMFAGFWWRERQLEDSERQ